MKKYLFLAISFLFLTSLKLNAQEEYYVSKIDSMNKVYLIKVKSKDFEGVIISDKENDCNPCKGTKKITIGSSYKIKIRKHDIVKLVNIPDLKVKSKGVPNISYEGINICKLNTDCIVYESDSLCGLYIK